MRRTGLLPLLMATFRVSSWGAAQMEYDRLSSCPLMTLDGDVLSFAVREYLARRLSGTLKHTEMQSGVFHDLVDGQCVKCTAIIWLNRWEGGWPYPVPGGIHFFLMPLPEFQSPHGRQDDDYGHMGWMFRGSFSGCLPTNVYQPAFILFPLAEEITEKRLFQLFPFVVGHIPHQNCPASYVCGTGWGFPVWRVCCRPTGLLHRDAGWNRWPL